MKFIIFKNSCLIIFVISLLYSCKKYEEGPAFSIKTVKARLSGEWQIEKYIVNNMDSTNLILNDDRYCDKLIINTTYSKSKKERIIGSSLSGKYGCYGANADTYLSKNKKNIIFKINHIYFTNIYPNCFAESNIEWKIIKLFNKKMSITKTINHVTYRIDLTKTKELY